MLTPAIPETTFSDVELSTLKALMEPVSDEGNDTQAPGFPRPHDANVVDDNAYAYVSGGHPVGTAQEPSLYRATNSEASIDQSAAPLEGSSFPLMGEAEALAYFFAAGNPMVPNDAAVAGPSTYNRSSVTPPTNSEWSFPQTPESTYQAMPWADPATSYSSADELAVSLRMEQEFMVWDDAEDEAEKSVSVTAPWGCPTTLWQGI